MPYYIEFTCHNAAEPKFRFLGLSAIHNSLTIIDLAGQTYEPDLMAKLRPIGTNGPTPLWIAMGCLRNQTFSGPKVLRTFRGGQ